VLILNHEKNGIKGYIGTSTIIEIGLAYYLGKSIFLMNALPHHSEHRWVHEVRIISPVILNGDLKKII
jgi:hypothetical protein